jgi:predicted ATPase/Tfp pilus assembly protein PilF
MGEHEFIVPPLDLPDPHQLLPLEVLAQVPSVQLFVQRATALKPDFKLTHSNQTAVVEICIRLEGLPLAIELAAARIRLFSPAKIVERLVNALAELQHGTPDLPPRQRSLWAAIEWSYKLLEPSEKLLLRRLAIFADNCTLEATTHVCNYDQTLNLDILEGLTSLLAKSLVRQNEGPEGLPQFAMLDIIREYALQQLLASGEYEMLKRQHALFYVSLSQAAVAGLQSAEQAVWLQRLESEHNNLRAALTWSLTTSAGIPTRFELGLQLGCNLSPFWIRHGHLSEGRQWLEKILANQSFDYRLPYWSKLRADLLRGVGTLAYLQGDYAQAKNFQEESLGIWQRNDPKPAVLTGLNNLAVVENALGDTARAKALLEESIALARELGDDLRLSASLGNLGNIAIAQGDYTLAVTLYEESLSLLEKIGNPGMLAQPLNNLGMLAQKQGDYARANMLLESRLEIGRELGDKQGIASALNNLGMLACQQNHWEKAQSLYIEGLAIWREIGYKQGLAAIKNNLGVVATKLRAYSEATTWFEQSLEIHYELHNQNGTAHALVGLANLAALEAQLSEAENLLITAQSLLTQSNTLLDPIYQALYEQTAAAIVSGLSH